VQMFGPAIELEKFRAEVRIPVAHAVLHRFQMARAGHLTPVPAGENQNEMAVPASVSIPVSGAIAEYREGCAASVQLPP
jgi:hypothetical protein